MVVAVPSGSDVGYFDEYVKQFSKSLADERNLDFYLNTICELDSVDDADDFTNYLKRLDSL